jgi:hypothetical protein
MWIVYTMSSYYPMADWKVIGIVPSKARFKKYTAVLSSGKRTISLNFGDSRYPQYKDSTGVGKFSHLDHGDTKRRANYKARHSGYIRKGYYSPGFFSLKYLWT